MPQPDTVMHVTRVTDPSLPEPVRELLTAIQHADPTELEQVTRRHGPDAFEDFAVEAPPVLVNLPYDIARLDPATMALRAAAIQHDPSCDHLEVAAQLRESMVRLSEAGRPEWGAFAGRWWLITTIYRNDLREGFERGIRMLDEHPQLRAADARLVARVASCASTAGERAAADALWAEARDHRQCERSADVHHQVLIDWCRFALLCGGRSLFTAARELERARHHFADRPGTAAIEHFHAASMLSALALTWLGRPEQAIAQLDADIPSCPHAGEYRSYLFGYRALAASALRRWQDVQRSLSQVELTRLPPAGLVMLALAPARLALAASRRNTGQVNEQVTQLVKLELDDVSSGAPMLTVAWRLAAASAFLELGMDDKARWLAGEAIDTSDAHDLPYFAARARVLLLQSELMNDRVPTAKHMRMVCSDIVERTTEPSIEAAMAASPTGLLATWVAVLGEAGDWATHRRVFGQARPQELRAAHRRARSLLGQAGAGASRRMLAELGLRGYIGADPIRVRLLGGFGIESDRGVVPSERWYGRRQARVLLARLILSPGVECRDSLAEDLWPGQAGSTVPRRLAPLVYVIRTALRDVTTRDPDSIVKAELGGYRVVFDDYDSCDAIEFERHARLCIEALDDAQVREHGRQALDAYGGELLQGDPHSEWLKESRRRLRNLHAQVVVRLASGGVGFSPTDELISTLEHAMAAEPTSEQLCLALMHAYASQGNVSGVTRAFHSTRSALDAELGIPPTTGMIATHSTLIDGSGAMVGGARKG